LRSSVGLLQRGANHDCASLDRAGVAPTIFQCQELDRLWTTGKAGHPAASNDRKAALCDRNQDALAAALLRVEAGGLPEILPEPPTDEYSCPTRRVAQLDAEEAGRFSPAALHRGSCALGVALGTPQEVADVAVGFGELALLGGELLQGLSNGAAAGCRGAWAEEAQDHLA
jgi:hypothetical protein